MIKARKGKQMHRERERERERKDICTQLRGKIERQVDTLRYSATDTSEVF